jgi:hypothetical protein
MNTLRWWQFGLVGGLTLSIASFVKLLVAIMASAAEEARMADAVAFFALMFAMGFVCGLVAWAGRGLYARIGMLGDSVVGVAVMVVFFTACMIVFDPDLLGPKFREGGVPMFVLAMITGAICGPWFARDFRKAG